MKTLGEQAKAFRESKGWNSARMAKEAKTSRQNIESLELEGNRIPKYIGDLAAAMGRSVDDMLVEAGMAPAKLMRKTGTAAVEWPLQFVSRDLYETLDEAEKGYVQAEMLHAIRECLDKRKTIEPGKSYSSRSAANRQAAG